MGSCRQALFRKRQFEPAGIVTCVRLYLRFSPSLRDIEELMAERNLSDLVNRVVFIMDSKTPTGVAEVPLAHMAAEAPIRSYIIRPSQKMNRDSYLARLDHIVSQKHMIVTRQAIQDVDQYTPGRFPAVGRAFALQRYQNLASGLTSTFSPLFINEFRFGYNRLWPIPRAECGQSDGPGAGPALDWAGSRIKTSAGNHSRPNHADGLQRGDGLHLLRRQ